MENLNFDKLYKQYNVEIRARIEFKLSQVPAMKNIECTSDILNDAFYKLYKHLAEFDSSKAQFNTWFYTIVDNTIIDYIRRYNKRTNANIRIDNSKPDDRVYEIPSNNVQGDSLVDNSNIKAEVIKAINKIKNNNHKKIAELFFINELNYAEISNLLTLPLGTVKPTVMRVKEFLQIELKNIKENVYS